MINMNAYNKINASQIGIYIEGVILIIATPPVP